MVTVEDVGRHYDELDPFYRRYWGLDLHHGYWRTGRESAAAAVRALADEVIKGALVGPHKRVCDVGCGYGGTSRRLVEEFRANVVAYTVSKAQWQIAVERQGGASNPRYVLGDFCDNDLPDTSVDAVIAIESTEHFCNRGRLFGEAMRILRPGGRLAVATWLDSETPKYWERRWLLNSIAREGRMPRLETEQSFRQRMR